MAKEPKDAAAAPAAGAKPVSKRKKEFRKKKEKRVVPHGVVQYSGDVQQHDRHADRSRWPHRELGHGRVGRLQGLAQGHARTPRNRRP